MDELNWFYGHKRTNLHMENRILNGTKNIYMAISCCLGTHVKVIVAYEHLSVSVNTATVGHSMKREGDKSMPVYSAKVAVIMNESTPKSPSRVLWLISLASLPVLETMAEFR